MPDINDVTILLVEDDPGHARLIEKNLRRANVTNEIDLPYKLYQFLRESNRIF